MHNQLELFLLGSPEVRLDGNPVTRFRSSKAQALLYYLAVTGRPHTRLALAGLFWGDLPDTQARLSLTQCLSNLHQLVGDYVIIERQRAAFNQEKLYWLDVETFVAGASTPHPEATIQQQREAVDLYRGDFLEGFYLREAPEFETWALAEQTRLRKLAVQTMQTLATHHTQQGDLAQAISNTRRLLSLEPWHEEAHRQFMLLLVQSGQRSAALAQYATCRRILQEELAVEPAVETVTLYEEIRAHKFDKGQAIESKGPGVTVTLSPPHLVSLSHHNLPPQPTPFIGRKQDLADILRRLQDPTCRLLTLVGPGGIGKSRLAIQAAQMLTPRTHGVWFVQLAPVSAASGMVAAIAEALNFAFYSNVPPRQQLLDYLREKTLLLVLDNFEHLLPDVDLISDILAVAPAVKILVTSRAALNLQEAWFHPIAGLPYPESSLAQTAEMETYDAVQLFVQCARRARVSFVLAAEGQSIVRICQLVEGMPLGIELAATWLKILSCEQIVQEIQRSLDFLSTRLHNVPARHRSMRAVFEQSWQLLSEEERVVLGRLSVLRGFRQEAAEQVAGASLPILVGLVEKALVRATLTGRYQMHELLRQFAAEKLATVPVDQATTGNRQSHYYLTLLHAHGQALRGKEQPMALDAIAAEIENMQAAWNWAIAQNDVATIDTALDSLYDFYTIRNRYQEGEESFACAAQRFQHAQLANGASDRILVLGKLRSRQGAFTAELGLYAPAHTLLQSGLSIASDYDCRGEIAFCLTFLAELAARQGHFPEASNLCRQSLAISSAIGNQASIARTLLRLEELTAYQGEYAEAKHLAQRSLEISRTLGRQDLTADALDELGFIAWCLGEYAEAEKFYRECLIITQEIGDQFGTAGALGGLGWLAWIKEGAHGAEVLSSGTEALAYTEKSLAMYQAIGHRLQVAMLFSMVGQVANGLGEYEQAERYCREGLALARELGDPTFTSYALSNLGYATCRLGDYPTSRQYLLDALKLSLTFRLGHMPEPLVYYGVLLLCEPALTPATQPLAKQAQAFTLFVVAQHAPQTWHVIKQMAARLQAQLEVELPSAIVTAARTRGEQLTLAEAITAILKESGV